MSGDQSKGRTTGIVNGRITGLSTTPTQIRATHPNREDNGSGDGGATTGRLDAGEGCVGHAVRLGVFLEGVNGLEAVRGGDAVFLDRVGFLFRGDFFGGWDVWVRLADSMRMAVSAIRGSGVVVMGRCGTFLAAHNGGTILGVLSVLGVLGVLKFECFSKSLGFGFFSKRGK